MIRPPAVSGRFYPDDPAQLIREVDSFLDFPQNEKIRARACMVPHAGYKYSGHVAGAVYGQLEIPNRVILVGPRHYPRGASLAILSEGAWQTPLGPAPIDQAMAAKIISVCPLLREDEVAHRLEHSLEVQLPFLQRLASSFSFVPIVTGTVQFKELESLGHAIATVIRSEAEPVLLVASSDMNHYQSDAITRVKDRRAIEQIVALEPRALFDTVRSDDISMCGYGAAVVMLTALRELGASRAELLAYATSGDINGDLDQVVGYAGMVVR